MIIGFVLLSHQNPRQLARLVGTLNRLYDNPPIACHHDSSQSPLDPRDFPANVSFVTPSFRTGWGKWPVVDGMLAALRLLYDKADPDWFALLSAADYPIASAERVRADFAASDADALIDYREVGEDRLTAARRHGPANPSLGHFEEPWNRPLLFNRYVNAQLWFPVVRGSQLGRYTVHLPFESPLSPFGADYRCYAGDHWFAGSRKAAAALLAPSPRDLRLQNHLRRRASADECYYQTVLCNRPDLKLQRDTRRFASWNGGGAHPKSLGAEDLDAVLASGAHFARKFAFGDPVLDRIDEALLNRAELA